MVLKFSLTVPVPPGGTVWNRPKSEMSQSINHFQLTAGVTTNSLSFQSN